MRRDNRQEDIQNMMRDTLIILVITVIAGLVLGFVYNLTKEPIEKQQALKVQKACTGVFAAAQEFEEWDVQPSKHTLDAVGEAGYEGIELGTVYAAGNGADGLLGYVVTVTSHEGYGGDITFLMGIGLDGTVTGVSILDISETPGLGMNAEKVLVPQFAGKNAPSFEYTKTGATGDSQIDAISGATITTKAVTNGVNAGLIFFREDLNKGGNEG